MRSLLILAAAVVIAGSYAAGIANQAVIDERPAQVASLQPVAEPQQAPAGQHRMLLTSDRQGHFHADARVDGRHIDFMVDTGASLVAVRESDAALAGIHPMPRDYTVTVTTANGQVKAAPATLGRIEIGDINVYDVPALVLPDEVLAQSLLGVTFLSRLRRYEYADGRMVLEQ